MTALVRYEAARRALAEAKTVDEVRDLLGVAEAMRAYGRQAKDKSLENDAKEIRWRAMRRLGEMIKAQKATVGLNKGVRGQLKGRDASGGAAVEPPEDSAPTLDDAGIDKKLSSRAQKYAEMGEGSFERLVARCRAYADQENETAPLDILATEEKEARRASEQAAYEARTADGCTVAELEELAAGGARFAVIYADPPWEFRVYSGKGKDRSADRHYNTGGLEGIKALPVAALAADNCVLHMWCVMPELPGALEVIKAWGFEFKTAGFTWVKQNKSGEGLFWGMGYWTRANAELCLLATKGSPERIHKDVHQVLLSPIAEHSRKPDEIQDRIERLTRGPYLELYARRPRAGWTVWGNEIPRDRLAATDGTSFVDPNTGEIKAVGVAELTELQALETVDNERTLDPAFLAKLKSEKLVRGSVKPMLTKAGMVRLAKLRAEAERGEEEAPASAFAENPCRVCGTGGGICAQCLPAESHTVSMTNDLDERGDHYSYATCVCGWKNAVPWLDHHEAQDAVVKAHWQSVVDEARARPAVSVTDALLPEETRPPESSDDDGLGIPGFLQRQPAEAAE